MKTTEFTKQISPTKYGLRQQLEDSGQLKFVHDWMERYASQAKPEPIKTKIDWYSVASDFGASDICSGVCSGDDVHPDDIIVWFKERIEKELNSTE